MPRPAPSLASVAADLARLVAGDRPAWIGAPLWRRLRGVSRDLAAAALASVASHGVVGAAVELGVHRDTLRVWAREGWLNTETEMNAMSTWKSESAASRFTPPGNGWDRVAVVVTPGGTFAVRATRGPVSRPGWDVLYGRGGKVLAEGTAAVDAALGI